MNLGGALASIAGNNAKDERIRRLELELDRSDAGEVSSALRPCRSAGYLEAGLGEWLVRPRRRNALSLERNDRPSLDAILG
jgi:hypothetical protein